MLDEILNERQVAQLLDCAPTTVREKARLGIVPAVKFGRTWRFPREALLQVLNEQALASKRPQPAAVTSHQEGKNRRRSPPKLPNLP